MVLIPWLLSDRGHDEDDMPVSMEYLSCGAALLVNRAADVKGEKSGTLVVYVNR